MPSTVLGGFKAFDPYRGSVRRVLSLAQLLESEHHHQQTKVTELSGGVCVGGGPGSKVT